MRNESAFVASNFHVDINQQQSRKTIIILFLQHGPEENSTRNQTWHPSQSQCARSISQSMRCWMVLVMFRIEN